MILVFAGGDQRREAVSGADAPMASQPGSAALNLSSSVRCQAPDWLPGGSLARGSSALASALAETSAWLCGEPGSWRMRHGMVGQSGL